MLAWARRGLKGVDDDVDDQELAGRASKDDAIAAAYPRLEVVLVRLDRLDPKARRLQAFDERENGLIAVALFLSREAGVALLEPVGKDRRREWGDRSHVTGGPS